jgi:transposase
MLSIPPAVKIFLCTEPTDLRRGFDGLATLVQETLGQDPLSGHLFMFLNRRSNRIKLLYWDEDGYAIWMKRLERGTFELPRARPSDAVGLKITASQLSLILGGIELSSVRRRRRFQLGQAS